MKLQAPFPWFGGKSRIAPRVWQIVSPNVPNYVEPFGGTLAALLLRPGWSPDVRWIETVNDADGFISNFWRAVKADPEQVARHADCPVNENDLHARHAWLLQQIPHLVPRLEGDPDFYEVKVAGWWAWGISTWIGHGWCSGRGSWAPVIDDEGFPVLQKLTEPGGVERKRPHLMTAGKGLTRQLPRLVTSAGINKRSIDAGTEGLIAWMQDLSARLRRVRIASGDWTRVTGPAVTTSLAETFMFLDPPYSTDAGDRAEVYASEDGAVAHDVRAWCVEHGERPGLQVILCGYRGEHDADLTAAGWEAIPWKAAGGYGSQGNGRGRANASREVLWINPALRARRAQQELSL